MSLVAWYPMNGVGTNQGLVETTDTWTTALKYANDGTGLITNSAKTGIGVWSASDTAKILKYNFSYCAWIKVIDTTNRSLIFGNEGMGGVGNSNNRHYSLFQYPTANDLHWSWQVDATSSAAGSTVCGGSVTGFFPTGEWVHLAVTYGDGHFRVYKNGVLNTDWTNTSINASTIASFAYATQFYSGNASRIMNDIRVYDHVLSAREVKEISKGLFLHWKLDNPNETNSLTNLYQSYKDGYFNESNFSRQKQTDTDGSTYYSYSLTYTSKGSDSWSCVRNPSFSFIAGKRYWYSLKMRVRKINNGASLYVRKSWCVNDYFHGAMKKFTSTSDWVEVYGYNDLTSTFTGGGATKTTYPCLEIYTSSLNATSGTVYTIQFDVKDICIYTNPVYLGFVDNTNLSYFIQDCSGFNNVGSMYDTTLYTTDTAKYKYALNTGQVGSADKSYLGFNLGKMSMALWFKPIKESTKKQHFLFSTCSSSSWINNGMGMWTDDPTVDNRKYAIAFKGNSASSAKSSSLGDVTFACGTWHHIVITYDGANIKFYKNGTLVHTEAYAGGVISNHILTVGSTRATGSRSDETDNVYINDFRIYGTALSADDVKNLYNVKAEIDNKAVIHTGEFTESGSSVSIKTNHTIYGGNYSELPRSAFDKNIYVEPDGSKWIRIFHHNNPNGGMFSSTANFTTSLYENDNRWFDVQYCNKTVQAGTYGWEFMIKQKATSSDTTVLKYRWKQKVNPMTATFDDVKPANVQVNTDVLNYILPASKWGGLYKKNGSAYLVANDGASGDWWGAIGSWSTSFKSSTLPSYNKVEVSTGYVDLYLRIDDLSSDGNAVSKAEINKNGTMFGTRLIEE